MSADAFEKTNFGWQLQQLQQQSGEWLELKFSQVRLPNQPNASLPDWLKNLFSWLGRLSLSPWVFKAVFWLVVAVMLTWVGWQLWQVWGHSLSSFPSLLRSSGRGAAIAAPNELTVSAWLQRSQEFYRRGKYAEACRSLYMALLQRLNDTGIAPHQPSRTDGEYRRLTQQLPQDRSYQTLLNTHEQLCFGNAEIAPEDFDRCQQAYREIQGQEAIAPNPPSPRGRNRRRR